MTEEELDDLFGVYLNKPYTDEEWATHSKHRKYKTYLELTYAHNFELTDSTDDWILYKHGEGPRPVRDIWKQLRPGSNTDNMARARLTDMVNYVADHYEHGSAPRLPILLYASRSTFRLIIRLEALYFSVFLNDAEFAAKELFSMLSYSGERKLSKEEYRTELLALVTLFVEACSKHATALGIFLNRPKPVTNVATKEDVENAVTKIACKIDEGKSEVVTKIEESRPHRGRPSATIHARRGYNNTEMMDHQHEATIEYLEVELHKRIVDVTPSDVTRLWNRPENKELWDAASKRKDRSRGYKSIMTLYYAVKNSAKRPIRKRN